MEVSGVLCWPGMEAEGGLRKGWVMMGKVLGNMQSFWLIGDHSNNGLMAKLRMFF